MRAILITALTLLALSLPAAADEVDGVVYLADFRGGGFYIIDAQEGVFNYCERIGQVTAECYGPWPLPDAPQRGKSEPGTLGEPVQVDLDERLLIRALDDPFVPQTNPRVFADLYPRALDGEDVTDIAREAFINHDFSQDDYILITSEVFGRTGEVASIYERARAALSDRLRPGPFEADVQREVAMRRHHSGMRDYDDWVRANPNASVDQYYEQVGKIGDRWSLSANREQRAALLPLPMFFQGTRSAPELDATQNRINDHFMAKHLGDRIAAMNDPEFRRALEDLQLWRDFMADQ